MSRRGGVAACVAIGIAATASATFAAPSAQQRGCRPAVHRVSIRGHTLTVCGRIAQAGFTDADHGWVLSIGNCALDLGVYAYRTEDGGRLWRRTALPLAVNCAAGSNAYLRARGSQEAVVVATSANACGSDFVRTFDGGVRWSRPRELPRCGGDLLFVGRRDGWYAGAFWSDDLPLFETRDGGVTWREEALPTSHGFGPRWFCFSSDPRFTGRFGEIHAVVSERARAVHAVYTTRNGGRSWSVRFSGRATLPASGCHR